MSQGPVHPGRRGTGPHWREPGAEARSCLRAGNCVAHAVRRLEARSQIADGTTEDVVPTEGNERVKTVTLFFVTRLPRALTTRKYLIPLGCFLPVVWAALQELCEVLNHPIPRPAYQHHNRTITLHPHN